MPYKDPEAKREWERQHRPERLARRRELRRVETAQKEAQPGAYAVRNAGINFLLPVIAGGALAAYSPKLAIGAGGVTMAIAGIYKKGWSWWVVGILIIVLGFFFYWSSQNDEKPSEGSQSGQKPLLL
jgi:4-hydroxybenzoate polyprenyltransferase